MEKTAYLPILICAVLVISGCNTTGLSMRENGSFNYSNFIYGLYDKDNNAKNEKRNIKKPVKLAVAQVGENSPPQAILDRLGEEPQLFSSIISLPAGGGPRYYGDARDNNNAEFEERMVKMRKLAHDLDTDYIFLFGGSADYGSTANWLQFFDITLIGGFLLPSNQINAEGRAAGALIDVATGQVIFMVNSEAKKQESAATFNVYERQDKVVVKLRDELVSSLGEEFLDKMYSL